MFHKKEKEMYEKIPSLLGNGSDYHVYDMTLAHKFTAFAVGALIGGVISYVFFRGIAVTIIVAVLAGIYAQEPYRSYRLEKRKKNLLLQFRDLMEALTSSYAVGKNTLDAFTDALTDMEQIYGSEELILGALKEATYNGVNNLRYIDKIIYEWNKKGFKNMEDVNNHLRNRNTSDKSVKEISDYNWLDE